MPCLVHTHKPWPTSGTHTLHIGACETHCGWCTYETKAANNLRVHARRHVQNSSDTSLSGITIVTSKAGRSRVSVRSEKTSQPEDDTGHEARVPGLELRIQALEAENDLLRLALQRARIENEILRATEGGTTTLARTDPTTTTAYDSPQRAHSLLEEESEHVGERTDKIAPTTSVGGGQPVVSMQSNLNGPDESIARANELTDNTEIPKTVSTYPLHPKTDPPGQQQQAYSGRALSIAPGIQYTRTGRISKVKKGLKVHTCECGRSYTRAEHLRRHQMNHAQEDALACDYPNCGKTFYRADLLHRHQERHNDPVQRTPHTKEEEEALVPPPQHRPTTNIPCAASPSTDPHPSSYNTNTVVLP